MCGLSGFLGGRLPLDERAAVAAAMARRIEHRGRDDAGEWVDSQSGLALGFRRLSIVDLSPAGHQPMLSASGRFVVVLNGEVYNFERIRAELVAAGAAPRFRGHSDTEVLLAAVEAWGLEAALKRVIGMFAIVLWDRELRELHLVRDRVGVKPLYAGRSGGAFIFGSELKALRVHPEFEGEIDRDALAAYFAYGYIPAPLTIYRNVEKVMPGTFMTVTAGGEVRRTTYWSVSEAVERGAADPFRGTEEEAADELEALLRDAVGLRMIADVPVGVFLSGGIDSSLVTALMQAQSSSPVLTFAIGSDQEQYDEAKHAEAVARHLGTRHTALCMTPAEAMPYIPTLAEMYDEPFADESQIPTHLVSVMARKFVKVTLSGDGGDELFGGYRRYVLAHRAWSAVRLVPRPLRASVARMLTAVPVDTWNQTLGGSRWVPRRFRKRIGDRIHRVSRMLASRDEDMLHLELLCQSRDVVVGGSDPALSVLDRMSGGRRIREPIARMMYLDQVTRLPDDIFVKVDRASMAANLEAREPLADHRLVELAWRLPLSMNLRGTKGKLLLRKVLARYVPRELTERPKKGFGVPMGEWLRGPLRDWAEPLISESRLRSEGILDTATIRTAWEAHLRSSGEGQRCLWYAVMFQAWSDSVRSGSVACTDG